MSKPALKLFEFLTVGFLLVIMIIITWATVGNYLIGRDYFIVSFPYGEQFAETIIFPLFCIMGLSVMVIKILELRKLKHERDKNNHN